MALSAAGEKAKRNLIHLTHILRPDLYQMAVGVPHLIPGKNVNTAQLAQMNLEVDICAEAIVESLIAAVAEEMQQSDKEA